MSTGNSTEHLNMCTGQCKEHTTGENKRWLCNFVVIVVVLACGGGRGSTVTGPWVKYFGGKLYVTLS